MHEWQSQSHVKWECKYHVVIVPKYRKKLLYGKLRNQVVRIHRQSGEKRLHGLHFWTVGYCVSTVGLDEQQIREYIQQQEKLETGQNRFEFE